MGRPRKRKAADPHTPAGLAEWAASAKGQNPPARTAELTVTVTDRGAAWVCRLWSGEHCYGVGRAGVAEKDARDKAVARAREAADEWVAARHRALGVS